MEQMYVNQNKLVAGKYTHDIGTQKANAAPPTPALPLDQPFLPFSRRRIITQSLQAAAGATSVGTKPVCGTLTLGKGAAPGLGVRSWVGRMRRRWSWMGCALCLCASLTGCASDSRGDDNINPGRKHATRPGSGPEPTAEILKCNKVLQD